MRQTRIGYHLDLTHANQRVLREAGVTAIGIDHWEPYRVWGRSSDRGGEHRYLVVSGSVHFSAFDQPVGAGELVTLPAGVERRRHAGAQPVVAVFVDSAAASTSAIGVMPCTAVTCCHAAVELLISESRRPGLAAGAEHLARLLVTYLMVTVPTTGVGEQRDRARLDALWRQVRDRPEAPWTTAHLASQLHCSPGHLHRLCAEHASTTPMRMVTVLRLEQAARLLQATDASVAQVADAVGFATASAFSDAFLRHFRQRPGRWRKYAPSPA